MGDIVKASDASVYDIYSMMVANFDHIATKVLVSGTNPSDASLDKVFASLEAGLRELDRRAGLNEPCIRLAFERTSKGIVEISRQLDRGLAPEAFRDLLKAGARVFALYEGNGKIMQGVQRKWASFLAKEKIAKPTSSERAYEPWDPENGGHKPSASEERRGQVISLFGDGPEGVQ